MSSRNPFEECPIYETDNLLFALVKDEDASELFECYSDPITKGHMNNDNCGGEWDCHSVEIVRKGIAGWRKEFEVGFYIRWSVIHKPTNRIIGTIEIAPVPNKTRFWDGVCQIGILRIDIISPLETEAIFSDILNMVSINFFTDFRIEKIIIKATPDDRPRVAALENVGFERVPDKTLIPYNDYYSKHRPSA